MYLKVALPERAAAEGVQGRRFALGARLLPVRVPPDGKGRASSRKGALEPRERCTGAYQACRYRPIGACESFGANAARATALVFENVESEHDALGRVFNHRPP